MKKTPQRLTHPEGLTEQTAQIWKQLRDHGGWRSAQELQDYWHPLVADLAAMQALLDMLASMQAVDTRKSLEHPGITVYAVNCTCTPLPSYELEPKSC